MDCIAADHFLNFHRVKAACSGNGMEDCSCWTSAMGVGYFALEDLSEMLGLGFELFL